MTDTTGNSATANLVNSAAPSRSRPIVYWVSTIVLGVEGIVGGALALVRWPAYAEVMRHLGYPAYLMTILGVWYTLAGLAVLAPRLPRLKEWAYAGLVINYSGAAASHLSAGDGAGALVAPFFFTGLVVASWALRPPDRRLEEPQLAHSVM
jgi:uncharacterized membrane protein YphA (DoxX/SURF4 family)